MKTPFLRTVTTTLTALFLLGSGLAASAVSVTFQVNMQIQEAITNFNPATHSVEVHGSFDSWGAGITLSPNQTNAHIYQGTVDVTGSTGAMFEHKFVLNKAGIQVWEGNVGPGGPFGNRTFSLADASQVLSVVYFNNLTNNPGAGIPVTFRLSMEVQIARGMFNPASGSAVVAGEFNNWSTTDSPLTNSPNNPALYVGTVSISTVSPGGSVPYKFVVNGGTWETGDNRGFILPSSGQTLPVDYFDRLDNLGPLSVSVGLFGEVTVSWTAGPGIRLQVAGDLSPPKWEDVPDTLGQSTATVFDGFFDGPPAKFFRLTGP